MTERLDLQKPPSKFHARANSRWYQRGYEDLPHPCWGDDMPIVIPPPPPPPPPPVLQLPGNPGLYTIAFIEAWVDDHPDLADEVLAAEEARPTPRVTLVDWLQGFISHRDEGHIP